MNDVGFWFWGFVWTYICAGACIGRTMIHPDYSGWERLSLVAACVLFWPLVFIAED